MVTARQKTGGLGLLHLAVFGGYAGQQILTPILPPLARELSISEFQYGMVMSASAAVVALVSPLWGRRADAWGRKPLMVIALFGAALGLAAFAATAHLGLRGVLGATTVFVLLLLARGILFGGSLAALPVAAQAYVADTSVEEGERIKGIARVGAAIGLALVLGPGLGGLLGDLGMLPALYTAPVLIGLVGVVVWIWLPAEERHTDRTAARGRLSPFDPRIRRFLVSGAGIYLSTSLLQSSIGFLLMDRLDLTPARTVELSGMVLLAGGLPMLVVQGLIIPKLAWRPQRLLRVGVPLTAGAFVVICLADSLPVFLAAVTVSGLGHSLAIPGYNSAMSLGVGANEQGSAAGLSASVNALTLVLGPLAATSLYQIDPALPFAVGAVVLAALLLLLTRRTPATAPAQHEGEPTPGDRVAGLTGESADG
ncbi:MFS transporter [Streptomyces sp. NPDC048361]|uniref:MFS transporter n=1 Tax=Streptomyces sp. NPDC048361 TaxID=3154720 RepID=UPI00343077E1